MNATIEIKKTKSGHLFRINNCGPWLSEYNTDSRLEKGEYAVVQNGHIVGIWCQETFGHTLHTTN